jgi:hypothetical protein
MKAALVCMFVGALFVFGAAHAADESVGAAKADTREAFEHMAASVRKDMEADGRYGYIKPAERSKVEAGFAEMSELFERNPSVDGMDQDARVKLFNAQESINAILTLRDRDRVVCERAASTGSHRIETTCMTYGQLEAARQDSHKFLIEKKAVPCISKACTGG